MKCLVRITTIASLIALLSSCAKDERTWTEYKYPNYDFKKVIYANGQFVVIGSNKDNKLVFLTSTDTINWSVSTTTMTLRNIQFAGGQFIYITYDTVNLTAPPPVTIMVSSDMVNWTQTTLNNNIYPRQIIYDGTRYLSIRTKWENSYFIEPCGEFATTPDLINWNVNKLPDTDLCFENLYYANAKYFSRVKYDSSGNHTIYSSIDGVNWNEVKFFHNKQISDMLYSNNEFIFTGDSGAIFTSSDGISWIDHSIFLGPSFRHVIRSSNEYFFLPVLRSQEIWSTPEFFSWKQYIYKEASFF